MTGTVVSLFNPRRDRWSDHFRFDRAQIVGISPEGRATVITLAMNHPEDIAIRTELIEQGPFPRT